MYRYRFYFGVEDIENFSQLQEQVITEYQNIHKYRLNFPDFDCECESLITHSGGGPTKFLLPELILFTSKYPHFTFNIVLTYYNNSKIYFVSIRDRNIISTLNCINVDIDLKSLLGNDISDWFTYYTNFPFVKLRLLDDD